ncbi:MAG: DedA family protein [Betaproteobacteria bacterium]|nr:MAG: DedA family protein [Betaproteobacteria bacterium]
MAEEGSLWALFISSFLAATLLPGGSEAVLFAVLRLHADLFGAALAVATVGNTLGGLTSYALGRFLPMVAPDFTTRAGRARARAIGWARRYGAPALLGAWLPLIGDPLCVAAGWLRLNWLAVTVFMALGKLARYVFVAWIAG